MRYAVNSELAEGDLADIWVEIATVDIDTADQFIEKLHALAQKLDEHGCHELFAQAFCAVE